MATAAAARAAATEEGEEEGEEEEEEESGEEGDDDDEGTVLRHVLLFNTWHEPPGEKPAYDAEHEAGASGTLAPGADLVRVRRIPFAVWRERDWAAAPSSAPAATTALVARLMGGPQRRGAAARFRVDAVGAARGALREALTDASGGDPVSFPIC